MYSPKARRQLKPQHGSGVFAPARRRWRLPHPEGADSEQRPRPAHPHHVADRALIARTGSKPSESR